MGKEIQDKDDHGFLDELEEFDGEPRHLTIKEIAEVMIPISIELGTCTITVRDVLELEPGNVLALSKLAGEMTDILVNTRPLARGEVVVLGDSLHVRIAEIKDVTERDFTNNA